VSPQEFRETRRAKVLEAIQNETQTPHSDHFSMGGRVGWAAKVIEEGRATSGGTVWSRSPRELMLPFGECRRFS